MAGGPDVQGVEERLRGRTLPLNSRRLTAATMQRVDTRLMIDGKLEDMEREPRNVQVVLVELEQGIVISLRDEDMQSQYI